MGSKFAANILSPTKSYDKYKPPTKETLSTNYKPSPNVNPNINPLYQRV